MEDDKRNGSQREAVRELYTKIAREGGSCCSSCDDHDPVGQTLSMGYDDEISLFPSSVTGLGCGNPLALGEVQEGETVVDLGSGAGLDAFLARRRVGPTGKVIGIDATPEMIGKADANAKQLGFTNVEFRQGDIEEIPLDDGSADVVISNCVINLASKKERVFQEIMRILKPGGRLYISDIVLVGTLSAEDRADPELYAGCVSGAMMVDDYKRIIEEAGLRISESSMDASVSDSQYGGRPVASLRLKAIRP